MLLPPFLLRVAHSCFLCALALGVEILAEIDRRILPPADRPSPLDPLDLSDPTHVTLSSLCSVFVIAVLTDFLTIWRGRPIRSPSLSPMLLPSLAFMSFRERGDRRPQFNFVFISQRLWLFLKHGACNRHFLRSSDVHE